jgi:hypothetical protein
VEIVLIEIEIEIISWRYKLNQESNFVALGRFKKEMESEFFILLVVVLNA